MRAGEILWLVDDSGTITACTVRGSDVVDQIQHNIIACSRTTID